MSYSLETLEEVQEVVDILSYGKESEENEKILQKCIQKAQFFKDKDLEFEARIAYIRQVTWLHKPDKTIAIFPWLLKRMDEGHNKNHQYSVLWMYKWVIIKLPCYASVSLQQIEDLQQDMERRFLDYGTGTRIIDYFRMIVYAHLGNLSKAQEHLKNYLQDTSSCLLDDCDACQPNNVLDIYLSLRDYPAFLHTAQPLLNGTKKCKEVPDYTYSKTAMVNFLSGNTEVAKDHAILARKKIPLTSAVLKEMGYLLTYYALTQDFIKGRAIIEKQIGFCTNTQPEAYRYQFLLGFLLFMKAFQKAGKKTIKLKVPIADVQPIEEDTYEVASLITWIEGQCQQIVQKLDQRNGNTFYSEDMTYYLSLIQN
ncbi:hypothetical protein QNI19_12970 [Cytophagaceae bacterium DM2B3-1]|uniref:Uncharacterized protein n=1 Tax=Xanthocytophaga flava TaxID=3048013 RepID=A0ABT7CJD3_9BACT|nr:hypothetical protein [Xanthocytophaga flavus]MDJ1493847.1 hypothetical protein [Xanthocytophaga flavus]